MIVGIAMSWKVYIFTVFSSAQLLFNAVFPLLCTVLKKMSLGCIKWNADV